MNFLLCKSYERIIYDFLTWKFRSNFHLEQNEISYPPMQYLFRVFFF